MKLPEDKTLTFPTSYKEILKRIDAIDPLKYRASRNYIDGAVSYLSPYISRGVISTKFIFDEILKKGHHLQQAEKFIQELAWRDYWQQVKTLDQQYFTSPSLGYRINQRPHPQFEMQEMTSYKGMSDE